MPNQGPYNSTISSLFASAPESSLRNLYDAELPQTTFKEIIAAAVTRFDTTVQRDRYLTAAALLPTINQAQVAIDSAKLEKDPIGTIEEFAEQSKVSRINLEILKYPEYSSFPEMTRLQEIATAVSPFFDPAFVSSVNNAAVRPQMAAIQPVVDVLIQTNYTKNEVIVVSLESFRKLASLHPDVAPLLSLSNIWHTDKVGCGRLLYDYKNLDAGTPINSEVCRDLYREHFGVLKYPSATSYIQYLFNARDSFPGEEIVITKTDIHRAYHRFRWTARGSLSLALLISPHLVAIPVTSGFGSNGPPFIYDVFRRFMKFCQAKRLFLKKILKELGDAFVDDMAFYAPRWFANMEISAYEELALLLLGQGAAHKREQSTRLDVIGYRFDSQKYTIGISPKGYLKLVYLFFVLIPQDLTTSQLYPTLLFQCLCGLVARYGFIIPALRYTTSIFYRLLRGAASRRRFTNLTIFTVQLWREYLIYAFNHSSILSTPCFEFFHNSPEAYNPALLADSFASYSDATLTVIGVFVPNLGWCEVIVSAFTDSAHSIANLEFIALILSFFLAHFLNPAQKHIHLFVDNQNAQAWASGVIRNDSNLSISLTCINSFLQSSLGIVQTRAYIKSADNKDADAISRQRFLNLKNLPRFSATSAMLLFLKSLVDLPDTNPFVNLHKVHTMSLSAGFCPF